MEVFCRCACAVSAREEPQQYTGESFVEVVIPKDVLSCPDLQLNNSSSKTSRRPEPDVSITPRRASRVQRWR